MKGDIDSALGSVRDILRNVAYRNFVDGQAESRAKIQSLQSIHNRHMNKIADLQDEVRKLEGVIEIQKAQIAELRRAHIEPQA